MAQSNHERVGRALELLNEGLKPYVERELKAAFKTDWAAKLKGYLPEYSGHGLAVQPEVKSWDTQVLASVMWNAWLDVFSKTLGQAERNLLAEIRTIRNNWAHQQVFTIDDTYRALDTIERMLSAVSAQEAGEIGRQKQELLRQRYTDKARKVVVKIAGSPTAGLKPWREVIDPHPDVASGTFVQAEFAADLWQVYLGEGSDEYKDPQEFYRRTYLTEGLKSLLIGALKRLCLNSGDPVIELQTNFGGGKTHSLLALYHLFSGVPAAELSGVEEILASQKLPMPGKVSKAVIVGNKIQPSEPLVKKDGTRVRTLWGEIAWQLGGKEAYSLVANADRTSTNPGDALKELFNRCAPCLVLIDEWVAYARQLYTDPTLPAGTFDTQFTFAQTLSEAAKNARDTFLVVSIPASHNEIGGEGGREALERLRNALGRVQTPWRPASTEEGFEIVRRRLFQPITDHVAAEATVRAFSEMYRSQPQDFPMESKEAEYERRMKRAYPIHPELFDRLYGSWSSLDRFQMTRGVLRLMAKVIYSLWSRDDRNLLILPSSVPLDDPDVRGELTKFLEENWTPVIERDVDGEGSLPRKLEKENTLLARYSAVRRVARTIYMGSAPTLKAAHHGINEKAIKLGCVQPGESLATFGDALRRLSGNATYLYEESQRYWYSTQPTVRKLAEDRAARLEEDAVFEEIQRRLQEQARDPGEFGRVHAAPASGVEVADEHDCRLVILSPRQPHLAKTQDSLALLQARQILEARAAGPRLYKNTLVFLAADKARLEDLQQAVRLFLAWSSIVKDKGSLNLDVTQSNQAEAQRSQSDQAVAARVPETYQWLLVPEQPDPKEPVRWKEVRLQGQDPLAARAARKLLAEEDLFPSMGGSRLQLVLNHIPLWRGNHVSVKQLVEDFAQYVYLPRVKDSSVIKGAIEDGVALMTWREDAFAYADSWDEEKKRYRGLKASQAITVSINDEALVVKSEVAREQLEREKEPAMTSPAQEKGGEAGEPTEPGGPAPAPARKVTRFYGKVVIDPLRAGRDASKIAEEVIAHLSGLVSSKVKLTLEVHAEVPEGITEDKQRIVNENCKTLKFEDFSFEEE